MLCSLHDPHCRKLFLRNRKLRSHLMQLGLVGLHSLVHSFVLIKWLKCRQYYIYQLMAVK